MIVSQKKSDAPSLLYPYLPLSITTSAVSASLR